MPWGIYPSGGAHSALTQGRHKGLVCHETQGQNMESVTNRLRVCRRWRESRQVTICVIYEDYTTGTRASELCRRLCEELGPRAEVLKRMWAFNELRIPRLRGIAAAEAAMSELVVISVHESEVLPREAEEWAQTLHRCKNHQSGVLVALLDPPHPSGPGQLGSLLAAVARQAGMEFVALQHVQQEQESWWPGAP